MTCASLSDTMMKFASFETIVEMLYKYAIPRPKDQCSKSLQLGVSFAGGYVAGVFCAIVSHPADNLVSFLNNAKGATVGDVSAASFWMELRSIDYRSTCFFIFYFLTFGFSLHRLSRSSGYGVSSLVGYPSELWWLELLLVLNGVSTMHSKFLLDCKFIPKPKPSWIFPHSHLRTISHIVIFFWPDLLLVALHLLPPHLLLLSSQRREVIRDQPTGVSLFLRVGAKPLHRYWINITFRIMLIDLKVGIISSIEWIDRFPFDFRILVFSFLLRIHWVCSTRDGFALILASLGYSFVCSK